MQDAMTSTTGTIVERTDAEGDTRRRQRNAIVERTGTEGDARGRPVAIVVGRINAHDMMTSAGAVVAQKNPGKVAMVGGRTAPTTRRQQQQRQSALLLVGRLSMVTGACNGCTRMGQAVQRTKKRFRLRWLHEIGQSARRDNDNGKLFGLELLRPRAKSN